MGKLEGKIAIVTGGGTGIGKGITKEFLSEGCTVIIAARDISRLDSVRKEYDLYRTKILSVKTDITKESDVVNLFSFVTNKFGRVDILVNNSGAFDGGVLEDITFEEWNRVISVNVTGMFLCTRQAFPIMKKQGGGRIINIGSIAAQRARHNSVPYTTSKHAVWGLTQSSALEGRDFGIAVSSIHPGNVAVERRYDGRSSTGRDEGPEPLIQPEEIGKTALLMATLPENSNMLEAIILPLKQDYLGRG
ncbi:MAG: short-chain dehydrogenase [Chloroflexi bacterium]|nr:short-chain dehydrogenase [Chloroflexota bacterium]|tara:strand:- start:785 stop:1528 length:744 start_codon:yes stop_codon:yes gene_type:complete